MEEEKKEEHAHHHEHHEHHEHQEHQAHHLKHDSVVESHGKVIHKPFRHYSVFLGLGILLILILGINVYQTFKLSSHISKNIADAKEKTRPANIELTLIKNSKCTDCNDLASAVEYIKSANVKIVQEKTLEFDSKDAKDLITKYGIDKIPNLLITGEIDKLNIEGLQKKSDALTLLEVNAPFTDPKSGKIQGLVTVYLLKDEGCTKCNTLDALIGQLKSSGIKFAEQKTISASSSEGKSLVQKYGIGFVPVIILSKDAAEYDIIQKAWPQVGTKETDGSYVMRSVYPPFVNLSTGKLRGVVSLTYLTDKSCTGCYDVKLHKQILTSPQSFAISLDKEDTVDISDSKGKELIGRYNITQVPTVVLSEEVAAYSTKAALGQFFSVEKDGYYVFRKPSVLGAYKDLSTNSIVAPNQAQDEQV